MGREESEKTGNAEPDVQVETEFFLQSLVSLKERILKSLRLSDFALILGFVEIVR